MDIKRGKKVVATIEARMTSNRLPGKVLMQACGKPMLELLIERLRRVTLLDDIVVATTTNSQDDAIVDLCHKLDCRYFRGSENDVLKRVLLAAKSVNADIICEITADCPLLDPDVTAQVIHSYLINDSDYVSNCQVRFTPDSCYFTYPVGMDTQVFSVASLEKADRETQDKDDREHVSLYLIRNHQFKLSIVPAPPSLTWQGLALTLDEKSDYDLIKNIFENLYPNNQRFNLAAVLQLLRDKPELISINAQVKRKSIPLKEIGA